MRSLSFVQSIRTVLVGILLSFSLAMSNVAAAAEDDPAGSGAAVSLAVFPGQLPDPSGRNRFAELDFVQPAGTTSDRKLRITGSAQFDSKIELQVFDARIVNDLLEPVARLSPIVRWIEFSENNFILPAGESREIFLTLSIPSEQEDALSYAYIIVDSAALNSGELTESEGAVAGSVRGTARYAMAMKVVTGEPEYVAIRFDLTDVDGVLVEGRKFLRIFLENQSNFSISPELRVQLVSTDFTDLRYGPFTGTAPEIDSKQSLAVDMPLPDDVLAGQYRILVEAIEGINTQRRTFEKSLTFEIPAEDEFVFPWYEVILGVLILGFLILLLLLIRSNRRLAQDSRRARSN